MGFLLREANFQDLDSLRKLAGLFPLCSLPEEESQIEEKIKISRDSFRRKRPKEKRNFLFILEDLSLKKAIGSSQILSFYGKEKRPFFLIDRGAEGDFLRLAESAEGRHQLGGLILHPDYRSSPERLGIQLGGIRMLYIGAFPEEFSSILEVSLTAPFERAGGRLKNYFCEEAVKPLIHEDYNSVIQLLRKEGAAFFSRFPKGIKIPLDSLSSKAKEALSGTRRETIPVYKGLLKMGFRETPRRHCADGGMYLEGRFSEVPLLRGVRRVWFKKPGREFWEEPAQAPPPPSRFLWGQQGFLESAGESGGGFFGGKAEGILKGGIFYLKNIPPRLNLKEKGFVTAL